MKWSEKDEKKEKKKKHLSFVIFQNGLAYCLIPKSGKFSPKKC